MTVDIRGIAFDMNIGLFFGAGDELLSDSFPYTEVHNGVLWEVEGKVSIRMFN